MRSVFLLNSPRAAASAMARAAFLPRLLLPLLLAVPPLVVAGPTAEAAPVVWSGYDFSFTRAPQGSSQLPANQDRITDAVILTREALRGIFNIAKESRYVDASPVDTEWAFPANNAGKIISAENWQTLNFAPWRAANNSNPPATVGHNAVVHLISDDIYLDIRFTSWGIRGAGGFSYERAVAPTFACGDLDMDRDVDSSDLISVLGNWTGHAPGSGSTFDDGDCDTDGDVDSSDFLDFLANWTGALAARELGSAASQFADGAGVGSSVSVPEPGASYILRLLGALAALGPLALRRRRAVADDRSIQAADVAA